MDTVLIHCTSAPAPGVHSESHMAMTLAWLFFPSVSLWLLWFFCDSIESLG